jgi:hypothetical protein
VSETNGHIETLTISLVRDEIPIELRLADGTTRKYKLYEMTGAQRDAWMTRNLKRARYDDKGQAVGVQDYNNVQADLIACCLYDDRDQAVPLSTIASYPARAQQFLFDKCQLLTGLNEEGVERAKKG